MTDLDRAASLILEAASACLLLCLGALVVGFVAHLVSVGLPGRPRPPAERELPTAEGGRFWVAFEPDTGTYYGACAETSYEHAAACPWEALRGIRAHVAREAKVRHG